jgi:hypothetical protein
MKTAASPAAGWLSLAEAAMAAGARLNTMAADTVARTLLFQLELAGEAAKAGQAQLEAVSALTKPDWYADRIEPLLQQAKTEAAFVLGGVGEEIPFEE